MTVREFAIPVALGLIVATAFWFWDPALPELERSSDAEVRIDTPYVLIPLPGTADHEGVLLRYNATPRHDLGGILDLHPGQLAFSNWTWSGTDLQCPRVGDCAIQGKASFTLPAAMPLPGAFGPDGYQANVTFYIFTSSGHLLATNAPRLDWEVYDLHGDFSHFSTQTWWFGPSKPPAGVADVPEYKTDLRGLLTGTPVGGVQSAMLEKHAYDWLVGPIWVTLRVDALA